MSTLPGFQDDNHCQASQTAEALCSNAQECEAALHQFLQFDEFVAPVPGWMLNIPGLDLPKVKGCCKGTAGKTTFLSVNIGSTPYSQHFVKKVGLKVRSNWKNSIVRIEVKDENQETAHFLLINSSRGKKHGASSRVWPLKPSFAGLLKAALLETTGLAPTERLNVLYRTAPQPLVRHAGEDLGRFDPWFAHHLESRLNHPTLTREEEANLCTQNSSSKHPALVLFDFNYKLVFSLARKYWRRQSDQEDLYQEGLIGLLTAVRKFDPSLGNKLSTYATFWIKQKCQYYNDQRVCLIRRPSSLKDPRKTPQLFIDLSNHGMERHEQQISTATPLHPYLNYPYKSTEDRLENEEQRELIQKALWKFLTPREAIVIELRFGFASRELQTLEQVGFFLGITRERVRQLEARAIDKLRGKLSLDLL